MNKLGLLITLAVINVSKTEIVCTTDSGDDGVCVAYYLCDDNNTIKTDGKDVIQVRFAEECPSMEICCADDDMVTLKPTIKEYVKQSKFNGCGYMNSNGVNITILNLDNKNSQYGEFPWMVGILREEEFDEEEKIFTYQCGGSLIHPKVVITSAHNVLSDDNEPIRNLFARAGEWDMKTDKEPYPHQDRRVTYSIVHHMYNPVTLTHDVAILILETPMILSETINPICLPNTVPYDKDCYVTGWGKDTFSQKATLRTVLKKLKLPIVNWSNCRLALKRTRLGERFNLDRIFTCAGGEAGQDACSGDGGSPLACPITGEKDRYELSGIVSWGIGCGDNGIPGVYTDVATVKNWIVESLENYDITL